MDAGVALNLFGGVHTRCKLNAAAPHCFKLNSCTEFSFFVYLSYLHLVVCLDACTHTFSTCSVNLQSEYVWVDCKGLDPGLNEQRSSRGGFYM
jgi:hypothetical protein